MSTWKTATEHQIDLYDLKVGQFGIDSDGDLVTRVENIDDLSQDFIFFKKDDGATQVVEAEYYNPSSLVGDEYFDLFLLKVFEPGTKITVEMDAL